MLIAISVENDNGLASSTSLVFGRSPYFIFFNTKDQKFWVEENPAKSSPGGAGVQTAQSMLDKKVNAVISGDLGPKAAAVLSAAGIAFFQNQGGTAEEALERFQKNELSRLETPSVDAHAGMQP